MGAYLLCCAAFSHRTVFGGEDLLDEVFAADRREGFARVRDERAEENLLLIGLALEM